MSEGKSEDYYLGYNDGWEMGVFITFIGFGVLFGILIIIRYLTH